MNIFVAGATGVIGRQLVGLLVERGDTVTGMTRTASRRRVLERLGARPVVADAFDAEAVQRAIVAAEPEVVVHQMTALSDLRAVRRLDRAFAQTSRLRTDGTDILLAASRATGVSRVVVQSYCGYLLAPDRPGVLTEDDALDSQPPGALASVVGAIRHLEHGVTGASWTTGVVLRYGSFYGPGTGVSRRPPGSQSELVRQRRFPIIGGGAGIWSFVHIVDAARATVAAIDHAERGIYHICDDAPAPVREWLPGLAAALGARPPRPVPKWLGRLVAGEAAVTLMTRVSGASNAKARRELEWEPRYRSWRDGFEHGLG